MKSSRFASPGWSGRAFIWRIFGLHKFFTPFWERVADYGTNDGALIFTMEAQSIGEARKAFLKNTVTIRIRRVRDSLRLESVHAATSGMEKTRESEDRFGRFFYRNAGSSFCNGSTA
jgi:hypothetical protein